MQGMSERAYAAHAGLSRGAIQNPRPGDLIVIGAESFAVHGEPIRDRDRLIWTVDLVPA